MRASSVVWLLVILALPFSLACRAPATSPAQRGTETAFAVRGSLEDTSCGAGLDLVDPLDFQVTLREQAGTIYWQMPGQAPVPGDVDADGEFVFSVRSEAIAWEPDPDQGLIGCALYRTETIEGTLTHGALGDGGTDGDAGVAPNDDAGADAGDAGPARPTAFEATSRIDVSVIPGTDCALLLTAMGGSFPMLPCGAEYRLDGQAR